MFVICFLCSLMELHSCHKSTLQLHFSSLALPVVLLFVKQHRLFAASRYLCTNSSWSYACQNEYQVSNPFAISIHFFVLRVIGEHEIRAVAINITGCAIRHRIYMKKNAWGVFSSLPPLTYVLICAPWTEKAACLLWSWFLWCQVTNTWSSSLWLSIVPVSFLKRQLAAALVRCCFCLPMNIDRNPYIPYTHDNTSCYRFCWLGEDGFLSRQLSYYVNVFWSVAENLMNIVTCSKSGQP